MVSRKKRKYTFRKGEPKEQSFEYKARFVVEGVFPSRLPKSVYEDCILEKSLENGKAILSVKVCRSSLPSDQEFREVEKIAREKASRTVNVYSLLIGQMRILLMASLEQATVYEGKRHVAQAVQLIADLTFSDDVFTERFKLLEGIVTPPQLEQYLSLALSHYSESLWMEPKPGFLNQMICMEALYNNDPQELRYRISHRVANLLGRTDQTRERIFNDMSYLYKKRSEMVHGSKPVELSKEDQSLLASYSKRSLMAFLRLRQKKNDIIHEIDKAIYDTKTREGIQEKLKDILDLLESELPEKGAKNRMLGAPDPVPECAYKKEFS